MSEFLSRVDLSDISYVVKQKAVRNAYKVYDSDGEEVLRSKQKLFKMKEEFPFMDPSGVEVFSVKAEQVMDVAGDYALIDSGTGEKFAVLKEDFTFLVDSWRIHDAEDKEIALIESRGKLVGLLRSLSGLFSLLPHKYSIKNNLGEQIGTISGKFGLRDRYEIELEEGVENKESILAAAITIDALEGN